MEVSDKTNSTQVESRTDGQIGLLILPSEFQVSLSAVKNRSYVNPIYTETTKISKLNRTLIQNCIFILFFLSLLLICIVILRRTFRRKNPRKISKVSFTRSRHRSVSGGVGGAWRDKDVVSPSKIWNVQDLEYYYVEPRRILWESYYGHSPNNRRGRPPHSSALAPPSPHLEQELVTFGLFQDTRTPPPKYKEVFSSVDAIRRVSLLELPTYSEATQSCLPSTNLIHENEDS